MPDPTNHDIACKILDDAIKSECQGGDIVPAIKKALDAKDEERKLIRSSTVIDQRSNIEIAAQLWCQPEHADKNMDVRFGESIVKELDAKDAERNTTVRNLTGIINDLTEKVYNTTTCTHCGFKTSIYSDVGEPNDIEEHYKVCWGKQKDEEIERLKGELYGGRMAEVAHNASLMMIDCGHPFPYGSVGCVQCHGKLLVLALKQAELLKEQNDGTR